MRFAAMLNPFTVAGYEIASATLIEETIRELYNSKPHIAAFMGIALAGCSAILDGGTAIGVWAIAIVGACLAFRIYIEFLYRKHATTTVQPKWITLFVIGSLTSGLGWGSATGLLLCSTSSATQLITVAVACSIIQGVAGRSYMMPGTAFINIALVLTLASIAAVFNGNNLIAPAAALYFTFLVSFIAGMIRIRLRQLRAEAMTERLLREITEKNALLRAANEKLAAKAFEDPLTGLGNRRRFDVDFDDALNFARQKRAPLSLLMIDVDHFKSFNDNFGHLAGDQCLSIIANAIATAVIERGGIAARYGGEEFVAILPEHDSTMAMEAAEHVRQSVLKACFSAVAGNPPHQTISIGVVSFKASVETHREAVLSAADVALYQAKSSGRNCVYVYNGEFARRAPTAPQARSVSMTG